MRVKIWLACIASLFIVSCSSDNLSDIKDYVKKIEARPAGPVEPLPQIEQFPVVRYEVSQLRDPFQSTLLLTKQSNPTHPLQDHLPEPLEAFPLDSLKMVGTLQMHNQLYAIISDPKGTIYRIHKGSYIGTNYGKVIQISANRVEVAEVISDNNGGWEERYSTIVMGE